MIDANKDKQDERDHKDAERMERVDSLFAELDIPLPYDLWLANSLKNRKIVTELKNRIDIYRKEKTLSKTAQFVLIELQDIVDRKRLIYKHTEIVKESEEKFKTHTKDQEVDI